MDFKAISTAWTTFWKSPKGKTTGKVLRTTFMLGMLSYLVYQIYQIGIWKILRALPTNPLFYLLFAFSYLALPISEQFIYGLSLKIPFKKGIKVFIEKKILNAEFGYSGEAYFFMWAKKNLAESSKAIFNALKDNNIISSFASTLMAILALVIFSYFGKGDFSKVFAIHVSQDILIGIGVVAMLAIGFGIYYRKYVISMSAGMAGKVFGIHVLRILLLYPLDILMWSIAVPDIPFHTWSVVLATKIIASRIPVLNQDILFMTIATGVMPSLMKVMDRPDVVAVILTSTVLSKIVGVILYTVFLSSKKDKIEQDIKASQAEELANEEA